MTGHSHCPWSFNVRQAGLQIRPPSFSFLAVAGAVVTSNSAARAVPSGARTFREAHAMTRLCAVTHSYVYVNTWNTTAGWSNAGCELCRKRCNLNVSLNPE
eukprot:156896-Prorocentrum_minimum.AAC.2